MKYPTYF